jgi:hypothetical protein
MMSAAQIGKYASDPVHGRAIVRSIALLKPETTLRGSSCAVTVDRGMHCIRSARSSLAFAFLGWRQAVIIETGTYL